MSLAGHYQCSLALNNLNADHLHIGSYYLQTTLRPEMLDLFQEAKRHGLTTSIRKGKHTLSEILDQPVAWEETIKQVEAKASRIKDLFEGVDQVIFTGCGSALAEGLETSTALSSTL